MRKEGQTRFSDVPQVLQNGVPAFAVRPQVLHCTLDLTVTGCVIFAPGTWPLRRRTTTLLPGSRSKPDTRWNRWSDWLPGTVIPAAVSVIELAKLLVAVEFVN